MTKHFGNTGCSNHRRHRVAFVAALALPIAAASFFAARAPQAAENLRVIELTQVPCQFLESEGGIDRGYKSRSLADCEAINGKTGKQRVAEAMPLELKSGPYVFRVTNRNVPYELGFWVRGASVASRITLPSVSGGGILPGKFRDYEIKLEPGRYVYSCPLNNTPDYHLVVR
jgi:hypothetical protein